jgi:hypothetical protein
MSSQHNQTASEQSIPVADVLGFCETENPDLIQAIADQGDDSFVVIAKVRLGRPASDKHYLNRQRRDYPWFIQGASWRCRSASTHA